MACSSKTACESEYLCSLDSESKERYKAKIACIGFIDPYLDFDPCYASLDDNDEALPAITYPDIVNYLLFSHSAYTSQQLKCYKSLEAFNQVTEGWVRDIQSMEKNDLEVVKGRVSFVINHYNSHSANAVVFPRFFTHKALIRSLLYLGSSLRRRGKLSQLTVIV